MNLDAIFAKTEKGKSVITERNVNLSPKQRQLLILIDGKRRLRDLFPTVDDTAIARIQALAEEELISGKGLEKLVKKPAQATPAPTSLTVARLPDEMKLARIRQVLAMCSQQYLSDELDNMLVDVFDMMSTPEELQFCIDQWLKRMQTRQSSSITNMYINQIKSFL